MRAGTAATLDASVSPGPIPIGRHRPATAVVHATAIAWQGRGVLLRGAAGAGKSSLALRMLAAGAVLVADDIVILSRRGRRVAAACPSRPGLIEARGLGIFRVAAADRGSTLALVADLASPPQRADTAGGAGPERLPEVRSETLLGVDLPVIEIDAAAPDAPARLMLALLARRVA